MNGYDEKYSNGTFHHFGAKEINDIFKSATSEQLEKISQILKDNGLKNIEEWMKNKPWFEEFDYRIERKVERDEWER